MATTTQNIAASTSRALNEGDNPVFKVDTTVLMRLHVEAEKVLAAHKRNTLLAEQNELLEQQNDWLEEQNASSAEQNELLARIADSLNRKQP